jgi:hypothetical protein
MAKIVQHPPAVRRGVTQLMYVGDDGGIEYEDRTKLPGFVLVGGAVVALYAAFKTKGAMRAAAIGALSYLALKLRN